MQQITHYRLKTHLYYGEENDLVYHKRWSQPPNVNKSANKLYELEDKDIDELFKIYQVILPLHEATKNFCESKGQINPFLTMELQSENLINQAYAYQSLYQFNKAKQLYQQALAIDPNNTTALMLMSNLKEDLGETADRIERLQHVVEIAKQRYGNDHDLTASALNSLGEAYRALGDPDRALNAHMESSVISTQLNDELNLICSLNSLGLTYYDLGLYNEALSHYLFALEKVTTTLQKNNYFANQTELIELTAAIHHNLADVYGVLSNHHDAIHHFKFSLRLLSQRYSVNNHPKIALILTLLGVSYLTLGKDNNDNVAIDYSKQIQASALAILKTFYNDNHPDMAVIYKNTALIYLACQQYTQAIEYIEKAVSIFKKTYAEGHIEIIWCHYYLSMCLALHGKLKESIRILEAGFSNLENMLSKNRILVEFYLTDLARNHYKHWLKENNKQALEKAFFYQYRLYSLKYSDAARLQDKLNSFVRLLNHQDAIEFYKYTYRVFLKEINNEPSPVAFIFNNLGSFLLKVKALQAAFLSFKEALELWRAIYGDLHARIAKSLCNLGITSLELEEAEKAAAYYEEALAIYNTIQLEQQSDVAECHFGLSLCHLELYNFEKVTHHHKQAKQILTSQSGNSHFLSILQRHKNTMAIHKMAVPIKVINLYRKAYANISKRNLLTIIEAQQILVNVIHLLRFWNLEGLPLISNAVILLKDTLFTLYELIQPLLGIKIDSATVSLESLLPKYEHLISQILAIIKTTVDKEDKHTAICHYNLGKLYYFCNKYERAVYEVNICLQLLIKQMGIKDPWLASMFLDLADIHFFNMKFKQAAYCYNQLFEHSQLTNNTEASGTATFNSAACYLNLGDYKQALFYLEMYKEIMASHKGFMKNTSACIELCRQQLKKEQQNNSKYRISSNIVQLSQSRYSIYKQNNHVISNSTDSGKYQQALTISNSFVDSLQQILPASCNIKLYEREQDAEKLDDRYIFDVSCQTDIRDDWLAICQIFSQSCIGCYCVYYESFFEIIILGVNIHEAEMQTFCEQTISQTSNILNSTM